MSMQYVISVIVTLIGILPATAWAELYKCKDSSGAVSYKDAPCAQNERHESTAHELASKPRSTNATMPRKGEPGLWERVTVVKPRASHPQENPGIQNANRNALEKAGDYKYLLGVPMKTRECVTTSPIEALLPKWVLQCDRQIKAHAGTCEASNRQSGMSGARDSFDSITGDYRSELHVTSRFVQGKDTTGKPIYDDSEMHIRYLGPCKADMRPGDVFVVGDDGSLAKQR